MLRYALRRLVTSVVTLILVILLTFFLMQAVPGGPFLGDNVSPEVTEKLLEKYGYDQPVLVQFKNYMVNLLQGDMGESMVTKAGEPVTNVIASYFPVSCKLGLIALALAVFIGIPMGFAAGCLAGAIKEWWDSKGHGTVEIMDFIFTAIGALCGACLSIPAIMLYHLIIEIWQR